MHSKTFAVSALVLMLSAVGGGCAGHRASTADREPRDCPAGQVPVCMGSSANSRVPDSKLNEKDLCFCQEKNP